MTSRQERSRVLPMLGGRDGEEGAPGGRGERGPFSSPLVSSSFRPVGPGTWQNPAIQLRAKEVAGRRPGLTEPRAGAGRAAGVRPGLPTPPGPRSSSRLLHPWGNLAPLALVRRPRGRPSGGLSWAPCVHGHVWLCNPMDCSPPGSSVHGILQARILEWAAISSSRGSS